MAIELAIGAGDVKKSVIPAITHADGSARVQIVTPGSNPTFHALLKAFERRKGVPIL
jgi:carbamoyltransferase